MSDLIPHGVCLASSPEIIGLIVFSNFSIALAYFAIPSFLAIGVSRFRTPVRTRFKAVEVADSHLYSNYQPER